MYLSANLSRFGRYPATLIVPAHFEIQQLSIHSFLFADHLDGSVINLWLTAERAIVFGERRECGFGLPWHVGVTLTSASFAEHFH